jgi:hypothetical protein
MALTALILCSRALLKLGAQTIASFDEGTAEAEVAANLYPSVRDAMLSSHPWSFATGQGTLARLAAVPAADHRHAYALPPALLRVLSAGDTGRGDGLHYRIQENRLHTDAEQVTLSWIFRPEEGAFPPFFASALIARLAAEFCLPLTENASRADILHRLAEQEIRHARTLDSQQAPPRAIRDFPLITARG